jgi:hypothetical protein
MFSWDCVQYTRTSISSWSSSGSSIFGSSSLIHAGLQAEAKTGQFSHRIPSWMKNETSCSPTSKVIVRDDALRLTVSVKREKLLGMEKWVSFSMSGVRVNIEEGQFFNVLETHAQLGVVDSECAINRVKIQRESPWNNPT